MKDMEELLKNMDEISKDKDPTREEIFKKLHEERNIIRQQQGEQRIGCSYNYSSIPACFNPPKGYLPPDNIKIAYCLDNLRCCVNPYDTTTPSPCGGTDVNVTIYQLSIVGCIPFILNITPVTASCGDAAGVAVSLSDTVCINQAVGYYATEKEARAACTGFNCSNITAETHAYVYYGVYCDRREIDSYVYFYTTIGNCE